MIPPCFGRPEAVSNTIVSEDIIPYIASVLQYVIIFKDAIVRIVPLFFIGGNVWARSRYQKGIVAMNICLESLVW